MATQYGSAPELAAALRRAAAAHDEHEQESGEADPNCRTGTRGTWWTSSPRRDHADRIPNRLDGRYERREPKPLTHAACGFGLKTVRSVDRFRIWFHGSSTSARGLPTASIESVPLSISSTSDGST